MQQSETVKHPRWRAFVSLNWYAGVISFLFRFLAMTSEPLLALGVILSAADFLQQGHLMSHNPALVAAWSWAQALAIEASTGPALAFSLDAFRARDKLKGRLYAFLAALLFIVGGAMLFLQLVSNVTGSSEASVTPWVLYPLLALRVLVASGIVALLCSKHLRFSGLVEDLPPAQPVMSEETMRAILARLAKVDELEQALARVTVQESAPAQIEGPENGLANDQQIDGQPAPVGDTSPIMALRFLSKEQPIREALRKNPQASPEQIAEVSGASLRTTQRWLDKIRSEQS
jgi:hypothetical protein